MTIVKIWGGLGNQLFQFAFAHYIKSINGEQISFVCENFNTDLSKLKITHFNCDLKTADQDQLSPYQQYFKKQYRIKRKLIQLFPFLDRTILVEKKHHVIIKAPLTHSVYDGYWQHENYLLKNEAYLRQAFQFKDESVFSESTYIQLMKNTLNPVGLHIRRGDFLKSHFHFNLNFDYYKSAIEKINSLVKDPVFFVCTNDVAWAKKHFKLKANMHFVDHSIYKDADLFDFYLMTNCKHNIIANSTFSWLAAWLNSNDSKIVLAPKNWYNGKNNFFASKFLPASWITL
ncbi:MAG: alpha-1,2-fucosyltransferase [Bacteroidetes bacterium]|nr:alpha-1,2-fucosyltransferase [Bacteroidota bacterium]